jgi:hypothetical protein
VFRNKLNKQKTNWNSSKFVKTSTFLNSPYHKFCLFRLFRNRSETSKQTKTNWKIFFWFRELKHNPNRLSLGLFRFEPRKKIYGFEDPLIEKVFWRFFWFVLRKFCLFRLFRYQSETPKQTETNQKLFFGFVKQTEKQPKKIEFRFVSVRSEKKIYCFEDTLAVNQANIKVMVRNIPRWVLLAQVPLSN